MALFRKKLDLGPSSKLELDWSPANAAASLQQVFDHAAGLANDAIGWYIQAKNGKRRYARSLRVLAIVLGTAGALLPTVGEH